jgi:hypothetical protein
MNYRLLVDLEVVHVLQGMRASARTRMLDHFERLRASPDNYSEATTRDATGRRIEVCSYRGYALHYWIDFADRHVKVLTLLRQR